MEWAQNTIETRNTKSPIFLLHQGNRTKGAMVNYKTRETDIEGTRGNIESVIPLMGSRFP